MKYKLTTKPWISIATLLLFLIGSSIGNQSVAASLNSPTEAEPNPTQPIIAIDSATTNSPKKSNELTNDEYEIIDESSKNPNRVNIKEVIRLTFEQSELIKIAKEKQIQTNLSAKVLDSTYLPNVNAAINTNQSKSSSSSSVNTNSLSLDLTKKIWQPLSSDMSKQQAEVTRNLADFIYQKSEADLIKIAAIEFLNVLKARYQIDYANATHKGAEDTLKTAQILFESGQTSSLELLRSQSSFDVAKATLLAANQDYAKKLTTLGNLVDMPIENVSDSGIDLLLNLADEFSQQVEGEWLSQMGSDNYDLKIAYLKMQLAKLNVQGAKKYAPELLLRANTTQYLSDNNNNNGDNNTSFGLSFSLPLYEAGNQQTESENYQSLLNESQLNYDLLKKELRYQLLDLEQRQSYINQLIIAYDNAEKSLKSQLEKTIEAYRSGVSEVNDVNDATTNYARSNLNLKLAKVDKMINFIELNHLLGVLSQDRVMSLF